jgi:hypothetical protein
MAANDLVRRVITAQTKEGKNVFAIDEQVESYISDGTKHEFGQQIWRIFGADAIPQLPNDAADVYADTVFSPPGGYRIQMCEFPGTGHSALTPRGVAPGRGTELYRTNSGPGGDQIGAMHCTNSVDIMVVMDGEIGLQLEGGAEVTLRKGDILVQNGVAHVWKQGPTPCRVCMVAVGAERPIPPVQK